MCNLMDNLPRPVFALLKQFVGWNYEFQISIPFRGEGGEVAVVLNTFILVFMFTSLREDKVSHSKFVS